MGYAVSVLVHPAAVQRDPAGADPVGPVHSSDPWVSVYGPCDEQEDRDEKGSSVSSRARLSGEGVRGTQVPEPDGLHCGPASLWQSTVSDDSNPGS